MVVFRPVWMYGYIGLNGACLEQEGHEVLPVSRTIMAVISQGDGSQQAGRARHRAGAGVGDDRPGQLHDAGCRCAASQRRLLCHYPLAQLDELIAAVATKCEAV